jgi:stress response protein SCP2
MSSTIPSFTKDHSAFLTGKIRLGAAWDSSARGYGGLIGRLSRRAGADLDAVAVMFEGGHPVRMAGIGNNDPLKNGSVVHSGDNQTGRGEGDDETIDFDLDRVDDEIEKIVLMVAAFKKANKNMGDLGFQGAENVEFTLYDTSSGQPQKEFRIRPSLAGRENCVIVAVLQRENGGWRMSRSDVRVSVEHGDQYALLRAAASAR